MRQGLVVRGDAVATAARIMAAEPTWRLAFTAELISTLAYVGVTALLYGLLKPVGRDLSRLAALLSLAGCAVGAAISLSLIAPLVLLGGAPYLAPIPAAQLQALSLAALKLHGQGYEIAMTFFGAYCLSLGILTFNSPLFPRLIGLLLMVSGLSWLTDTLTNFLDPPLSDSLGSFTDLGGFLGEASLTIWLLILGLRRPRQTAPETLPAAA
jgi:hypothetical protein